MSTRIQRRWAMLILSIAGLVASQDARADIVVDGTFGPNGDVGFATSSPVSIAFGAANTGSIYQMDGFVNVPRVNYGNGTGMGADLANGAPAGLTYAFRATQPTVHQLLLTYSFTNASGPALPGFQFLYFVDPDITSDFANNSATVNGSNLRGLPNPTSFQVGDPASSTLFGNLLNGTLSNTNDFPPPTVGDVAMGLGFTIGTLGAGQSASFEVLLSDNGTHLGNFSINQTDPAVPTDSLTVSGLVVPEPASWISMALGAGICLAHAARTGLNLGLRHAWTRSQ